MTLATLSHPTLKIKRLHANAVLPVRAHPSDAGLDLVAVFMQQTQEDVFAFDTGLALQAPAGYYTEVVARSSIVKSPFCMANAVGVIDPDYRGSVVVFLRYVGKNDGKDNAQALQQAQALVGTRIAQLLVRPLPTVVIQEVNALDSSTRGIKGVGSSGVKPL